jgi:hypothetical protein
MYRILDFGLALTLAGATLLAGQQSDATISGRVVTRQGAPAAGIRVAAAVSEGTSTETTELVSIAKTDSEGRYVLERVPPGRYYVMAGPANSPTFLPGTTVKSQATVTAVAAASSIAVPDLPLALSRVAGHINGPAISIPLVRDLMRVTISANPMYGQHEIGPDGSFQLESVPPSDYAYVLHSVLGDEVVTIMTRSFKISGTEDDVDLTLTMPPIIAGKVVMENGGTLPQVACSPLDWFSLPIQIQQEHKTRRLPLGPNGAFATEVSEGDVAMWINSKDVPLGYEVRSISDGTTDLLQGPLKVSKSSFNEIKVTLAKIPAAQGRKVSGLVTGVDVSRGSYSICLQGIPSGSKSTLSLKAEIRADGTFEYSGIPAGRYRITLMDPQGSGDSNGVNATTVDVEIADVVGIRLAP